MTIRVIIKHADGSSEAIDWLVHDRSGAALFAIDRAHDLGVRMLEHPDMTEQSVEIWHGPILDLSITIRPGGLDPVKAASKLPTIRT